MKISRRKFLKYLGIGVAGLAIPVSFIEKQDVMVPMSWSIQPLDGETFLSDSAAWKKLMIESGLPGPQPLPLIYGGKPFVFPGSPNGVVVWRAE